MFGPEIYAETVEEAKEMADKKEGIEQEMKISTFPTIDRAALTMVSSIDGELEELRKEYEARDNTDKKRESLVRGAAVRPELQSVSGEVERRVVQVIGNPGDNFAVTGADIANIVHEGGRA